MALRINLLPAYCNPSYLRRAILSGDTRWTWNLARLLPWRWIATLAALVIFVLRWVGIVVLCLIGGVIALPFVLLAGVVYALVELWKLCRNNGEPYWRWCVVIECAPEEFAAVEQTLRDLVDPHERLSWKQAGAIRSQAERGRDVGASGAMFVGEVLKTTQLVREELPSQFPALFFGGRLTMQWLAGKLRAARIPCHVAWLPIWATKNAERVRPETLHDDWLSLIAHWTWAPQPLEPEDRPPSRAGVLKNGSWIE
jgi:hypothetical protein